MAVIHEITSADDFRQQLRDAGSKLVVVDFYALWCGPCRAIAPHFEALSNEFTDVVFLKVNVDEQEEIAEQLQVTAMPTFMFFKSGNKIGLQRGANPESLRQSVVENRSATAPAAAAAAAAAKPEEPKELLPGLLPGHVDLSECIDVQSTECLNEASDHPFTSALHAGGGYLESECDEQLIMFITFNQPVKIHTMQVQAPDKDETPKTLRLFINLPNTLDFDSAESNAATQEIVLKKGDTTGNGLIPLTFVKFQNVQTLQVFVKDNQGGSDTSIIDHIAFYGAPVATTNMKDFKRVSGKAGEVHGH